MKLDFSRNCVCYKDILEFEFDEIVCAERLSVENVRFLAVQTDRPSYYFFYCERDEYYALLKKFADEPSTYGKWIKKYESDFGLTHMLLVALFRTITDMYGLNQYSFGGKVGLAATSEYMERKGKIYDLESIDKSYEVIRSVFPENIKETRKKEIRKCCDEKIEYYKSIFGGDFEHLKLPKEKIIYLLNKISNDNKAVLEKLEKDYELFKLGRHEQITNVVWAQRIEDLYNSVIPILQEGIALEEREYLLKKYGDLSEGRKNIKKSLEKLAFMDSLELYREYQEKYQVILAEMRQNNIEEYEGNPWNDYLKYYHYGSILISDHMNRINKNKAKNRPIPQKEIDAAMIYFYDSTSAEEAYEKKKLINYKENKVAGNVGEKNVNYALKWLDKEYVQIEERSQDKVGNPCILIKNEAFIDEMQEFDHIIVCSKGIFVIETKNYKGTIIIDDERNWSRVVEGERVGIINPIQQVRQHEKLLKSFLPEGISIISIVCIANDHAIIEGTKYSDIPVIKSDRLVEYIESYNSEIVISEEETRKCIELIYKYMQ